MLSFSERRLIRLAVSCVSTALMPAVGSSRSSNPGRKSQCEADFQIFLFSVRQVGSRFRPLCGQPDFFEHFANLVLDAWIPGGIAKGIQAHGAILRGEAQVLRHRKFWKDVGDLKCEAHPQPADFMGLHARRLDPVYPYLADRWPLYAHQHAEKRALARAVRADDGPQLPFRELEVDMIDRKPVRRTPWSEPSFQE